MVEVFQRKEASMETIQKSTHRNMHIIYTDLEQESRGAYVLQVIQVRKRFL